MSCSVFQWYEKPTLKVSSPLEQPCWWEELLNVNSLHIDSAKKHILCSAFQWYENSTLKVSSPLEHPCWWEELLNVNSLQIDSAKDTCPVPLSNGTKILHWRYHHRWNILVDERNSWMWIPSILIQQKTHVLFRFPMVQKSYIEGIITAGTSLLMRGTLECEFPPYWFSKRHMSYSAFQWYENLTWKVSTPLEHPCWWEELLNVNFLKKFELVRITV